MAFSIGWLFLSHASAQSLYWIGTAGFARSTAWSVSADGTTVVGSVQTGSQSQAFRWKHGEGLQLLGALGGSVGWGGAVSANGQVVVGSAALPNGTLRAFRWSEGLVGDFGGRASEALGVSLNNAVVGRAKTADGRWLVFRWTPTTGLGNLNQTYRIPYEGLCQNCVLLIAKSS